MFSLVNSFVSNETENFCGFCTHKKKQRNKKTTPQCNDVELMYSISVYWWTLNIEQYGLRASWFCLYSLCPFFFFELFYRRLFSIIFTQSRVIRFSAFYSLFLLSVARYTVRITIRLRCAFEIVSMKEGSHMDLVTPMGLVNDVTALLIPWSEQFFFFYRQSVCLLRKTIATHRRVDILFLSICVRTIVLNAECHFL